MSILKLELRALLQIQEGNRWVVGVADMEMRGRWYKLKLTKMYDDIFLQQS